ncbi:MAG: preprotein translocase subunit SecE [Candidatus Gracilibacteria bacterium]
MAAAKKNKKNGLIQYFEDSYSEIRKVQWPTKNTAVRLTFLVLGFVFAVAILIGILDFIFGTGYRALLDVAPEQSLPSVQTTDGEVQTVTTPEIDEDGVPIIDVGTLSSDGVATVEVGGEDAPATDSPETTTPEAAGEEPAAEESST